jgi:hypothetical protein
VGYFVIVCGTVAIDLMGKMRNASTVLGMKPEMKRMHGRPRHGRSMKEIGYEGVYWIYMAQDRGQ